MMVSGSSVDRKIHLIEWRPDPANPFAMLRTATATKNTESIVNAGNAGIHRVRP